MKSCLKTVSIILVLSLMLACGMLFLSACDKKENSVPRVDYARINDYAVKTETATYQDEMFTAKLYYPENVEAEYGLLFFVGTIIAPEYYDYLGNALAKQGYVVAIPSVPFAYFEYETKSRPIADAVRSKFDGIKFFVGGHSQGGGAAMRFACEEIDSVQGAILLAPLTFGARESTEEEYEALHEAHPEWFNVNNDGSISRTDTLKNVDLPTLLLEADGDKILSDADKNNARAKMPKNVQRHLLAHACHMGFSTSEMSLAGDGADMSEEDKENQRFLTASYVLDFLQITVCA